MIYIADIKDGHILRTVRSVMDLCGAHEDSVGAKVALCDESSVEKYAGVMRCIVLTRDESFSESDVMDMLSERGEVEVFHVPFPIDSLVQTVLGSSRAEDNKETGEESLTGGMSVHTITCEGRTVSFCGKTVELTEKEFGLFECLYKRAGKIVSREEILCEVWSGERESNIVDVYASYLRRKLDLILPPGTLSSVRGLGYVLKI